MGQPIGLIVAERRDIAFQAVELVKVRYSSSTTGVVSMEEKIAENEELEPSTELNNVKGKNRPLI